MTKIDYQKEIIDYYDENIKICSNCNANKACYNQLPKESEGYFERGPEVAYVGEYYGKSGYPKILFTRLNPIKEKSDGKFFFGSRKSLEEYRNQNGGDGAKEIFRCYLEGWPDKDNDRVYIGLRDAGTVTGHSNQSDLSDEDKQPPHYGIQSIMNKMMMIETKIFDEPKNSPLRILCNQ